MEMLEDEIPNSAIRAESRQLMLPRFMADDRGARDIVDTWAVVFRELFNYQGEITDTIDDEWWYIQFTDNVDTTNMTWDTLSVFLLRLAIRLSQIYTYEQWWGHFEYIDLPGGYEEGVVIYYDFSNETKEYRNIKTVTHKTLKVPIDDEEAIREVQELVSERRVDYVPR